MSTTITFEALADELGLDHWWMSILMQEAGIYAPIGMARRTVAESAPGEVWRAAPLTGEFAELCRGRYATWPR